MNFSVRISNLHTLESPIAFHLCTYSKYRLVFTCNNDNYQLRIIRNETLIKTVLISHANYTIKKTYNTYKT